MRLHGRHHCIDGADLASQHGILTYRIIKQTNATRPASKQQRIHSLAKLHIVSQMIDSHTTPRHAERTIEADIDDCPARLPRHASIAGMCLHDGHHCIDGTSLANQHLIIACHNNNGMKVFYLGSQVFM